MKIPEGDHAWRHLDEVVAAGRAAGLDVAGATRSFIVPRRVPLLHGLNDVAWAAPLRQRWGLLQRAVFSAP